MFICLFSWSCLRICKLYCGSGNFSLWVMTTFREASASFCVSRSGKFSITSFVYMVRILLTCIDVVFLNQDFFELWPHKFQNKTNGVTPVWQLELIMPKHSVFGYQWIYLALGQLTSLKTKLQRRELFRFCPSGCWWIQKPGCDLNIKRDNKTVYFALVAAFSGEDFGFCCNPLHSLWLAQRRWLAFCNPGLKEVITKHLETEAWITNLDLLSGLRKHVENEELLEEWRQVLVSLVSSVVLDASIQ